MDAGGTKLAVRAETLDGRRVLDERLDAEDWDAAPIDHAVTWIRARLQRVLPGERVLALGLGAQGCDTQKHCTEFEAALRASGLHATVVNDAALLVPAAGFDSGIGVIAGTGAIAVGHSAAGDALFAGGWGWVLGDDAGAPGIVRQATRAALHADDDGCGDDGLLGFLLDAFAVGTPQELARTVNDEPTPEHWGPKAPAVFAAADAGSARASSVIDGAADHLAELVGQLVRRGAVGAGIVAAGSVITNQPRLADAFSQRIRSQHPHLVVHMLEDDPVAGGIVLARRLLDARTGTDEKEQQ
jgi:N-acetylglucosamine kinase-like BadF-type ATPase